MEPPKFYHYAKASGLVKQDVMDKILADFEARRASKYQAVASTDLKHLKRPARLRGSHPVPMPFDARDSGSVSSDSMSDATEASLDGESLHHDQARVTALDRRLSEELVRRGLLNRWQATQLLDGRSKFSLGDYWVLDAIGKGGYGHVFLGREDRAARKRRLGGTSPAFVAEEQFVALKVLPLARSTPELSQRFLHEIDLQKNLYHPNLVRFLASGRDGNVHYMVHEFVDGGDLRELLHHEGPLPIETAAPVIGQAARALQYLHENGVVHRDVKPANILLASDGHAKLTDMGLAVNYDRVAARNRQLTPEESNILEREVDSVTKKTSKVAGTVDYMAPDQIRDPSKPSPSWDVYSLGCMFYHILTGFVPFSKGELRDKLLIRLKTDPADVRVLAPLVPFDIADLLRKMLTRDPSRRIATAAEVVRRLDAWTPPLGIHDRITFDPAEIPPPEPPLIPLPKAGGNHGTVITIPGR